MSDVVAVREPSFLLTQKPQEIVQQAREQANALMAIVDEKHLYAEIGTKKHIYVEAWQAIARFNGCLIETTWSKPISENGEIVGYEARAELVRLHDGAHLVGAEAECRFAEDNWTDRDHFAVRSMAQTRAQSKVGRMAYAWVAVLAGYAGTPAEEMTTVAGPAVPFGKHKGKPVAELAEKRDVAWLMDAISKSIADPDKKRFKAANERLYDALAARLNDLSAPSAPAPSLAGPDTPAEPWGASEWRHKFVDEVLARQEGHDKARSVLTKLMDEQGILQLDSIPSREKAVAFFQEYLRRTGGKQARQETMPV